MSTTATTSAAIAERRIVQTSAPCCAPCACQSQHGASRSVCEMREVYIAAVGLTKVDLTGSIFGNVFELFQAAYRRALVDSPLREFDAVQVGITNAEEFENRANIATKVA